MDMFEKARDGVARLDVSEKVKASALGQLRTWLTDPAFAEYVPQIRVPDRVRQVGGPAGFVLPGDPLRDRGPPGSGRHRTQPDQRLGHPGLRPGALPVPAQAVRRGGEAARGGDGLRRAQIHSEGNLRRRPAQPGQGPRRVGARPGRGRSLYRQRDPGAPVQDHPQHAGALLRHPASEGGLRRHVQCQPQPAARQRQKGLRRARRPAHPAPRPVPGGRGHDERPADPAPSLR